MQWCELMTPDPETAAAFYRILLKSEDRSDGDAGRFGRTTIVQHTKTDP